MGSKDNLRNQREYTIKKMRVTKKITTTEVPD